MKTQSMCMSILVMLCITNFAHAAADELTIVPLKERPELFSAVVDLWWEGQGGATKAAYDLKPIDGMSTSLSTHLNTDSLPLCLIALKNTKLVGMVRLADVWTTQKLVAPKIATHPEWSPWLCGLIVTAEHRKRGIGTALLNAGKEKARQLGIAALYLGARNDTQEWYIKKHGFKKFEEDTFHGEPMNILRFDFDTQQEQK